MGTLRTIVRVRTTHPAPCPKWNPGNWRQMRSISWLFDFDHTQIYVPRISIKPQTRLISRDPIMAQVAMLGWRQRIDFSPKFILFREKVRRATLGFEKVFKRKAFSFEGTVGNANFGATFSVSCPLYKWSPPTLPQETLGTAPCQGSRFENYSVVNMYSFS